MMSEGMSAADFAALSNNDGFGGSNAWFWIVVLFLFSGSGLWGNNSQQYATSAEVQRGFDNQNVMTRFDTLQTTQAANSKENALLIDRNQIDNMNLINQATMTNMQNTNSINSNITNGVFGIQNTLNTGFDSVNSNINNLAHQMEQCCCGLKTQMLQDKYDALLNQYNLSTIANSNSVQTQNILNAIGSWYAKPPYSPYYTGTAYTGTTY